MLSHQRDDFMSAWSRFTASRLSCKWLKLLQQRRQQFTDGGVDWHGAFNAGVGLPSGHHIEQGVDDFVAVQPQNAGTQQALVFGIDQHLHKALGLTRFACAANALHRHLGA